MKIKTVWDSGPYSYSYEVPDDDPQGREISKALWDEYNAVRDRYLELERQVEAE